MTAALERASSQRDSDRAEGAGYRLQMTLIDLIDLTLQIQHLRWNLFDEPELRRELGNLDALVRAGSDEVARRLRALGVAPDGTIGAVYQDLVFEPLPSGPFDEQSATKAFVPRLGQMGHRLTDSIAVITDLDPESADLLRRIADGIEAWSNQLSTEN